MPPPASIVAPFTAERYLRLGELGGPSGGVYRLDVVFSKPVNESGHIRWSSLVIES